MNPLQASVVGLVESGRPVTVVVTGLSGAPAVGDVDVQIDGTSVLNGGYTTTYDPATGKLTIVIPTTTRNAVVDVAVADPTIDQSVSISTPL